MTDKEKIGAYVKRLQKPEGYGDYWKGYDSALNDILSFIDSLQEETELSHSKVTKKSDQELTEFEKELISYRYGCEALSVFQGEHLLEVKKEADYFLSLARKQIAEEYKEQLKSGIYRIFSTYISSETCIGNLRHAVIEHIEKVLKKK